MISQIAVFLENKKGRLADMTRVLGDAGVDLVALTIADTKEFGIVRFVTKDNDKVLRVLKEAGYTATKTELVGIEVADVPGGLSAVLKVLGDGGAEIEYLYSFAGTHTGKAAILFKVADVTNTVRLLTENGIELIEKLF
ncbi:MAG: ACT domain-containing protein [Clostridiales bacterium]|jgi:hypothetical protein|nr:ACT domain-containing protein [Clostridiales bacterium]